MGTIARRARRARAEIRERGAGGASLGDGADDSTFLAVAFPHDQVQILPYNRIVLDLGGLAPDAFLQAVRDRFELEAGSPMPARRGEIAMYVNSRWHTLRPRVRPDEPGILSLDVSVLQDQLLAPVLKIADVRTDKRIDFVGGARGTGELEQLVDSGKAAVAFSLYPVSIGRSHGGLRRWRDHAAKIDVVRAQAPRWVVDTHDLGPAEAGRYD